MTSIASLRRQVAELARQTRPHPVQRRMTTAENRHELARILGPIGIPMPRNREESDVLIQAIEAELGARDLAPASACVADILPDRSPSENTQSTIEDGGQTVPIRPDTHA